MNDDIVKRLRNTGWQCHSFSEPEKEGEFITIQAFKMEEILKLPFCIVVIHAIKSIKNLRKHVTIYFIWAPINNLLMLKGAKHVGPLNAWLVPN